MLKIKMSSVLNSDTFSMINSSNYNYQSIYGYSNLEWNNITIKNKILTS